MSLNRQRGFGIPELLVGIAVGMVVVAAAMQMLFSTLESSNDNIKMARLEQDLRQAMLMITRDLRRATSWNAATDVARVSMSVPLTLSAVSGTGVSISTSASDDAGIDHLADLGTDIVGGTLVYMHTDVEDSDGDSNLSEVFVYKGSITGNSGGVLTATLTGTWPVSVRDVDGVATGTWTILRPQSTITVDEGLDCLLFAYDVDPNGAYASNEQLGYRHDSTNKAVEIRKSSSATCSSATSGNWEDLTDPDVIEVTDFSITDNSPGAVTAAGLNVSIREVTISITGRLKSDTSVVRTFQETVRVRNDRLS